MESIFKVYEGNHILIDAKPLVIITGIPELNGIRSEVFIFVQNENKDFYSKSFFGKPYQDSEALTIKIDMDFILSHSVEAATEILNNHLKKKYEETKIDSYLKQTYVISETDPIRLFGLIKRNLYKEKVEYAYKFTRSRKLKLYINRIYDSPKISIIE